MYLILPILQSNTRNNEAATSLGWDVPNAKRWSEIINKDETLCALDVLDGKGLSSDELAHCVDLLPDEFNIELTM